MKTAYDWCLEHEMRILEFGSWDIDEYHTKKITDEEFKTLLSGDGVKVKPNSTPRKANKYLERRMYSLVPYNIMPIQKGIQHEHSVVNYIDKFIVRPIQAGLPMDEELVWWIQEWKTSIILNGGTTNEGSSVRHGFVDIPYTGSLQTHLSKLMENEVRYSFFREPDLGSTMSGVSFLIDERVFNRALYEDYKSAPYPWNDKGRGYTPKESEIEAYEKSEAKNLAAWTEKVGGPKNVWLRSYLRDLKLAN